MLWQSARHHGEVEQAAALPNDLRERVLAAGRSGGLAEVGTCSAEAFLDARQILHERKAAGLNSTMAFTYRNPERSTEPSRSLPDVATLVVGAYRYPSGVSEPPRGLAARVARYATADYYGELRVGLNAIAQELVRSGHRAVVLADDNALMDRAAAHRAALGWYGRSSNLLLPGQGSWFVLGSVLTDAQLGPSAEPVPDSCGTCQRCVESCPTGAIVADGVVDARRCLAWHLQMDGEFPREFREALGDRIYGCDECQEVCPPNRRLDLRDRQTPAPPGAKGVGPWVDVNWLLTASDSDLLDKLGRWYIARRDPRILRRNALVILGNIGDPADSATVQLLERWIDDPDDLLAGHAAWAALRMNRADLLQHTERAERTAVRAEMADPPPARQDSYS